MKKETTAQVFVSIQHIQNEFSKKKDKVSILWDALDIMQAYNGRRKWDCVAMAMGYDNDTGNSEEWYLK